MIPTKRILLATAIFIVMLLSSPSWLALLNHLHFLLPSVDDAVGASSFIGYPKQIDFAGFDLCLFTAAVLFAWAGWKAHREAPTMRHASWTPPRMGWAWFILVSFLISTYFFPSLYDASFATSPLKGAAIQWDSMNITSWDYLYQHGFLPYRDFWYPYGGQIFQHISLSGQCFYALQLIVVLTALFYFAIYFSRSFLLATAFTVFLLIELHLTTFQSMQRYSLPLLLICCFSTALQNLQSKRWAFITGLIGAYIAFYELNLILGPLLGGIIVVTLNMFEKNRTAVLKSVITMSMTCIAFFSLWLLCVYSHGQWKGYLDFYSAAEFRSMANYAFQPANLHDILRPSLNLEFITFILFVVMISRCSYLVIKNRFKLNNETLFLIPVVITTFLLFMKDLCRPWMSYQMISFIAPAILFWLMIGPWQTVKKSNQKWIQIAALLISIALLSPNLHQIKSRMSYGFSQAEITLRNLSDTRKRFDIANENHFQIDIASLSNEQQELVHFLQSPDVSKVYVLGDASWIYLALQQNMPFYINHYNGSRVSAQNKNIEWTQQNHVNTLVLDTNKPSQDGIPNEIRGPILFAYLTQHFIFQKRIGSYLIFRRSDESTEKNLLSWKESLGFSADVGAIPFASLLSDRAAKIPDCAAGSENCFPVLKILPKDASAPQHQIVIQDGQHTFSVSIKNYHSQTGFLRIDRLWFWPIIHSNTASFHSSTAEATLTWKRLQKDWPLY